MNSIVKYILGQHINYLSPSGFFYKNWPKISFQGSSKGVLLTPYTYVARVPYLFLLSRSYVIKETNPETIEVDLPYSGH